MEVTNRSGYQMSMEFPRGQYWAPTLFLIYVNDCPIDLTDKNGLLYVDDITLFSEKTNQISDLNYRLENINQWSKKWKINFGPHKFQWIEFGKDTKTKQKIVFDGFTIEKSKSVVLLGVHLKSDLTFQDYWENVVKKKIDAKLAVIRPIIFKSKSTMIRYAILYWKSNNQPIMEYCAEIWAINKTILTEIDKSQIDYFRNTVMNVRTGTSTQHLLCELGVTIQSLWHICKI